MRVPLVLPPAANVTLTGKAQATHACLPATAFLGSLFVPLAHIGHHLTEGPVLTNTRLCFGSLCLSVSRFGKSDLPRSLSGLCAFLGRGVEQPVHRRIRRRSKQPFPFVWQVTSHTACVRFSGSLCGFRGGWVLAHGFGLCFTGCGRRVKPTCLTTV